jgi:hypothetical protein
MEEISPRQLTIIKFIFSRIFPLPFIIAGTLLFCFGVKGLLIAHASIGWPHTNATVISSAVKSRSPVRGQTQHQAEVHYEFILQEKRYHGYHSDSSTNAGYAMSLVERYPNGSRITVYYKPDNPAESLLEPGLALKTWIMPLGGLMFFIPGILMAIFLPRLMKKAGQATEQGTP